MTLQRANFERRIGLLHDLAEKVRTVAEATHDLNFRQTMSLTAACYERMAKRLENSTGHLSLPEEPSPQLSP
jgi:hypothetical protein